MTAHRSPAWIAGLALLPDLAAAHAFSSGADQYAQFVEGTGVPLGAPAILLVALPLGVLIGLAGRDGMPLAWPGLLAGLVAGWLAGPLIGPEIALAATGVGAVLGTLGAVAPAQPRPALLALSALAGALAMLVAIEGHGRWELPVLIPLGIVLGVHLVVVLPAAVVSGALACWPAPWMRIGWRVLASWIAAAAVIYLAFLWTGVPGG